MNERIKQLAEQAVNSIPDHVDFDIPDAFKQKFAELIVAECIREIAMVSSRFERNHGGEQALGAKAAGYAVAIHFGVEE